MMKHALLITLGLLVGCAGTAATPVSVSQFSFTPPLSGGSPGQYIKHLVIVVQENRSFDNLFAGFPGADAPTFGYAGTQRINLHATPFESPYTDYNDYAAAMAGWDHGKMDGFEKEDWNGPKDAAYAYVPLAETAPYWKFASQYVLADRMFPTEFGASFTAHLSLIAGNTNISSAPPLAEVDAPSGLPWGCDAPPSVRTDTLDTAHVERSNGPFPCFSQFPTLADGLDKAGVSWKYYAAAVSNFPGEYWSEFSAIHAIRYGPDWKNDVISPPGQILTDVQTGALASVSWITPDWLNSDHAGSGSKTGPSWVASIVNTIGQSKYWSSTAIVVVWDEWGGWYDDAAPPQLDFRGLGIRVPCIIISPYARIAPGKKAGYVSHTLYEYGSILKFAEDVFGLPRIGPPSAGFTDTRANSIVDSFDFSQAPRPFVRAPAHYPAAYFRSEQPSFIAPDQE